MDYKKYILITLLGLFFMLPSWGQSQVNPYYTFLNYCNSSLPWNENEIKWLKYILKAETCQELVEKISKLKSYNEFKVPVEKSRPFKVASWTYEFPEIYGLKSKYDISDVEKILKVKINPKDFFTNLSNFYEFRNLTIIDFTDYRYRFDVCSTINFLRYRIKTIIIDWGSLEEVKNCKFTNKIPDIIISGDYVGKGSENIADHIIGIEHFVGRISDLQNYTGLRFVGLSLENKYASLSHFRNLQHITHLTINSTLPNEEIAIIGEMDNLAYLALTCVKDELKHYRNFEVIPKPCDKPYLKKLDFLKNLTWLESLNLSYSGLENVDELLQMEQLKSLDISHNRITIMPDFSVLKELKKLNSEGQE